MDCKGGGGGRAARAVRRTESLGDMGRSREGRRGSLVPICRGDQLVVELESELAYAFIAFGVMSGQGIGMRGAGSARP